MQALVVGSIGWFSGSKYTIPNQNFVQEVEAEFGRDGKIVLACQQGLRSGAAAEKLDQLGFTNVACIREGLDIVQPGALPKEGSVELREAGVGGISKYRNQILITLSVVLLSLVGFLQFFPDQGQKVLNKFYVIE